MSNHPSARILSILGGGAVLVTIGLLLTGRVLDLERRDAERRFDGVLLLSVDPDRLAGDDGPAEVGQSGMVMLPGMDRVVCARSPVRPPQVGAVGTTFSDRPLLDPAPPPAGVQHGVSPVDGTGGVIAYRRLRGDPLVAVVALGEAEAMAGIEPHGASVLRVEAVVTAIVLAGTVLVAWLAGLQEIQRRRLDAAREQLIRTEERWRLALEAVGDGVWDWNARTGEVFYSTRWKAMLGFADDEIASRIDEWDSRVHPEDRAGVDADLKRHLSGETPFYANRHRMRCKDGGYRWILDRGVAVSRAADGTPLRVVGTHTDITEMKRTEEILERQTAELRRSNAELEAFAYVASHDLRQPLRTISGHLGLLDAVLEGKLDEEGRESMGFVRSAALRMDRLIVDLLEYSRVGRRTRPFQAHSAAEIVETAVGNLDVAIAEAGATVVVAPDLPVLWGDDSELARLFQNLIGNAVKYRAADRPPAIHVACAGEAVAWRFTVRDNGIGVAPEHFERIFGIFQRLHGRDAYEGTGIGLAMCRKIVEHHGGRIWVEAAPGGGCAFHFTLPRIDAAAHEDATS